MNYLKLSIRHCVFVIVFLSLSSATALSDVLPFLGKEVPIERVIENLENQISTSGKAKLSNLNAIIMNDGTIATLARVHAMAYAFKIRVIKAETEGEKDSLRYRIKFPMGGHEESGVFNNSPRQFPDVAVEAKNENEKKEAKAHLERAIELYKKVSDASPITSQRALLGLGWLLEQDGRKSEAREQYRKIFKLTSNRKKSKSKSFVIVPKNYSIESSIGHVIEAEAAHYLVALLDKEKDAQEIKEIKESVYRAYRGYVEHGQVISPIAIPLSNEYTRADLLDLDAAVSFNLDGSGMPQKWSWITPKAAWLVFIPKKQAMSGMFLFGEVTFWAFWNNGYQALCALDDSQDGVISGDELARIELWQDRDSDGIMTKDELITLKSQGIAGFRCDGAQVKEGEYWQPKGALLANGQTLPTYDFLLVRKE